MFAVTLTALGFLIKANAATGNYLLVIFAVLLFILAILLIIQTYGVLTGKNKKTTVGM
jgi:carbon starvation protein